MDKSPRLSGEEWQRWAEKLLTRHYGSGEYQKVPDDDRGDAGIEGYSVSNGCAYQIYGPEEALTTKERYEKYRSKITTDIKKFITNKSVLERIFGGSIIRRWILLVPYIDSKEIVIHASKKTNDVLKAKLPYVDNSQFRILVEDESTFSKEREELLNYETGAVEIISENATEEAIVEWAEQNDILVKQLDDKVSKLPTLRKPTKRRIFRDQIIKHYLDGQNILEELRQYSLIFEKIRIIKSQKERYLATRAGLESGSNSEYLKKCLDELVTHIQTEVKELSNISAEALAWESVSDWMIRCPLDFPDIENLSS